MAFKSLFSLFSSDLAIDLGTANTLVYANGRGIVVSEPSIVAINKVTNQVEAVGRDAKEMLGRTPGNIVAIRPMKDGVIANFEVTEKMLQHFIRKAHNGKSWVRPRVVIGIPSEITQVERRAVEDSAYRAKASEVYLVEEAMAAAIGAGLPITEPHGNMVVDIGGGTTDIAIFIGGSIRYTENVTLGGDNIDRDIALGLSTPLAEARRIKEKYGTAIADMVSPDEMIEVPSVGGKHFRKISRKDLAMVIEPRMDEIFSLVKREIKKSGLEDLMPAGAVITGGSVIMNGTVELAEMILEMPVRMGIPTDVGGLTDIIANPVYSTGVGLVLYGVEYKGDNKLRIRDENVFKKIFDSMKNWFQEFF